MPSLHGIHQMTTSSSNSYVFIRISSSQEIDDNDDHSLLVQTATSPTSNNSHEHIVPIFSREDYDALINMNGCMMDSSVSLPTLKKLFSLPLPENEEERNSDDSKIRMASVFESSLSVNQVETYGCPPYKIMRMKELFQLVESSKHSQYSTIQPYITNHILHLYRQHQLDSRIPGRRLLHGTSGSNIDDYTLRPEPAVVFFDCDDCLYFDNWVIAGHLTKSIEDHCQNEFGLPKGHAYKLYKEHGTALRGLIAEGYLSKDCSASMDGFLEKAHDLPIHELLSPDAQLRSMILSMRPSIRKFVFTASVSHHAQRCLEALGIADLIEGIIDVKDCQFETKHSVSSFHVAMEKAGVDNPEACIFLDDSVKNIEAARTVGWRSVLVGKTGRDCGKLVTSEHAEHEVDRIHQLPEVFPELFHE
ncbi:hypothetical protein ACHAXR_006162 [Thalassiosira sp. AJA248-18]